MTVEIGKVYRLNVRCNEESRGRLVRVVAIDGYVTCEYVDRTPAMPSRCYVDPSSLDEVSP